MPVPRRVFHVLPALLTLLTLVAAATLAGCGRQSGGAGAAARPPEKPRLRIGALPIVDDAPLYIAQQRGFFKDEGLDVTLVQTATPPVRQLVGSSVDIGFVDYLSMFGAQARGLARFRLLAEGYEATDRTMGIVAKRRDIDDPLDLAGKRIAVNTEQEAGERVVSGLLVGNGVDPEQVTYQKMPFRRMATALQRGEVDAAWMVEPFITEAGMSIGARLVLDAFKGPVASFPVAGYVSSAAFAERNPRTVLAFQRAINRAQRAAADRATVEQILPTYTHIDPRTAVIIAIGGFPTSMAPSPVRIQRVANLMLQVGMLRSRLEARTVLE